MNEKIEIDQAYTGPSDFITDVNTALQTLSECLSIVRDECATHSVIVVQGFDDDEVLEASAIYLVSAISQNIDANLILSGTFNDTSGAFSGNIAENPGVNFEAHLNLLV